MLLQIPRGLLEQMVAYCRDQQPREACGLLTGLADGRVTRGWALHNMHPEPQRQYRIDPVDLHTVEQDAVRTGEALLAAFHSHPGTVAYPSRSDVEQARPGLLYVIISLAQEPPDIRVYRIRGGAAEPVPFRKVTGKGEWLQLA